MEEVQISYEDNDQQNHLLHMLGRFALGASAGFTGGLIGGALAYEIASHISHEPFNAAMILGPAIGVGIVHGVINVRNK